MPITITAPNGAKVVITAGATKAGYDFLPGTGDYIGERYKPDGSLQDRRRFSEAAVQKAVANAAAQGATVTGSAGAIVAGPSVGGGGGAAGKGR